MVNPRLARSTFLCLVLVLPTTLGGGGCAHSRSNLLAIKEPVREAGVVFVVDGAGNFQACSQHIRLAARQERLPIQVVTVEWSHGFGRIIADQIGYAYARAKGCELAQVLQAFRREHPCVPMYLLGHSAGSAVVIAALESLPPVTIERAFLLAPSLSATYDLSPALKAVRTNLHVFYSERDTIYLGLWTGLLGNSDRCWGPSSGRFGFQYSPTCSEDVRFGGKLIQRPWQPVDRLAGNDGKHYGDYQIEFVRLHILPLFANQATLASHADRAAVDAYDLAGDKGRPWAH
jgi:hypothetical protein